MFIGGQGGVEVEMLGEVIESCLDLSMGTEERVGTHLVCEGMRLIQTQGSWTGKMGTGTSHFVPFTAKPSNCF